MRIGPTLVLALVMIAAPRGLTAQSVSDDFGQLVGVWDTRDTYHPVDGPPLVETGVRTCRLALRDQYLQCDTEAVNARGIERTYRWMINYNRILDRFEMLSIWSNVPFKAVSALQDIEGQAGWRLASVAVVGSDEVDPPTYSELKIETPDRIVWTGRRVSEGVSPEEAPVSFVETWTRRGAGPGGG